MKKNDIQSKIEELDKMIEWFESDQFSINDALIKYEKAEILAGEIKTELNEIKNKVTVIKKRFDES